MFIKLFSAKQNYLTLINVKQNIATTSLHTIKTEKKKQPLISKVKIDYNQIQVTIVCFVIPPGGISKDGKRERE